MRVPASPPPPREKCMSRSLILSALAVPLVFLVGLRAAPAEDCHVKVETGYIGAACCENGGDCAGTYTEILSYSCQGECPPGQSCTQTSSTSLPIKVVTTCAGSCPIHNCNITQQNTSYGVTTSACECAGPA